MKEAINSRHEIFELEGIANSAVDAIARGDQEAAINAIRMYYYNRYKIEERSIKFSFDSRIESVEKRLGIYEREPTSSCRRDS